MTSPGLNVQVHACWTRVASVEPTGRSCIIHPTPDTNRQAYDPESNDFTRTEAKMLLTDRRSSALDADSLKMPPPLLSTSRQLHLALIGSSHCRCKRCLLKQERSLAGSLLTRIGRPSRNTPPMIRKTTDDTPKSPMALPACNSGGGALRRKPRRLRALAPPAERT